VFSVAPSGLVDFTDHPRLTPWAAFLRRFAAGFHYPYQSVSLSVISLSVGITVSRSLRKWCRPRGRECHL